MVNINDTIIINDGEMGEVRGGEYRNTYTYKYVHYSILNITNRIYLYVSLCIYLYNLYMFNVL